MRNVVILPDQAAIASRAAELLYASTTGSNDRLAIALAGGNTPKLLYRKLAAEPWRGLLPWQKLNWYFGDERFVPADDPQSNFRMARENLLEAAKVNPDQVFPVNTGFADAKEAAADYNKTITSTISEFDGIPAFDLILLGMGEDGHTASLFPGTTALGEQSMAVAANYVEKLSTWRITLTTPVLLAARQVVVMVSGAEKAAALAAVLEGPTNEDLYPSQILNQRSLDTTWLVDRTAASQLSSTTD